MSDELPVECEAFAATVNAVLDGDAPAAELACEHVRTCRDCRELAAAARLLATAGPALRVSPVPPADLRPQLAATMVRTRQRQHWVPMITACTVLFGGAWLLWPTRPDGVAVGRAVPETGLSVSGTARPTKAARVSDQLALVASVARSASDKASAPARLLTAPDLRLPAADLIRPTTADAIAPLEQAAKATAEPVAGTARRAVGLFLRDFGLTAKPAG